VTASAASTPSPSPFSALSGTGTTKVWLACGVTDMRKGFDGLAVLVQQVLEQSPHSGALFAFRGRRGHLIKLLWYDGQGMCLFSKALLSACKAVEGRLDRGRFIWPMTQVGSVALTSAQLSMLLEGIDWRRPERTWTPSLAG
jgi:transposase